MYVLNFIKKHKFLFIAISIFLLLSLLGFSKVLPPVDNYELDVNQVIPESAFVGEMELWQVEPTTFNFQEKINAIEKTILSKIVIIKPILIFVLTSFSIIQISIELLQSMNDVNMRAVIILIIRRTLGFCFHLSIISLIFKEKDGILSMVTELAYGIVETITGIKSRGVNDIFENAKLLDQKLRTIIMQISDSINWKDAIYLDNFLTKLLLMFLIFVVIAIVYYVMFMVMVELVMAVLKLTISVLFSAILIPLSIFEYTKNYYSLATLGKLIVNGINFIVGIQVLSIIGIQSITVLIQDVANKLLSASTNENINALTSVENMGRITSLLMVLFIFNKITQKVKVVL